MKMTLAAGPLSAWFLTVAVAFADDTLPVLQVGSEVYSNVTVTAVSATDVYFSHAGGLGNAKLKNLSGELQTRFHFDAAKAGLAEQRQREANAGFRTALANQKPAAPPPAETVPPTTTDEAGDLVVTKLYARSFRGQRPPSIVVDEWLTPPPPVEGKFVLVVFWTTECDPCRKSIPHLNELQAQFKDRLIVMGLGSESSDHMRKASLPRINYYVGTDPQSRTMRAVEVRGIPHALLMDPQGIVRFEGMPDYLDAKGLEHLISRYAQ